LNPAEPFWVGEQSASIFCVPNLLKQWIQLVFLLAFLKKARRNQT